MIKEREALTLHSLGVVVLADSHNPTVLNPDFARSNRIIPDEWRVTRTLTTPGLSVLTCGNGVEMVVDPNRLGITQQQRDGRPFQGPCDDSIHDVTLKYARFPTRHTRA